jgi:predicted amidohydrolase
MKLYLVQFHPEPGEKEKNLTRILEYIDKGLGAGANLICFGETALTGYELTGKLDYKELAEPIPGPATDKVAAKIKGKNCLVCFGMQELPGLFWYAAARFRGHIQCCSSNRPGWNYWNRSKTLPREFLVIEDRNYLLGRRPLQAG